jgi:hypothetical protein
MNSVYIGDIKIRMIPAKARSRLRPIFKTLERYPVVCNESMIVNHELMMRAINRFFKDRDISLYKITYEVSNLKFSSKCQWTQ